MIPQKTKTVSELLIHLSLFVAILQCYGTEITQVSISTSSKEELEFCHQMNQRLQSVNSTYSIDCQNHTRETSGEFDSIEEVWKSNADVAMTTGDEMITVKRSGNIPIISSKNKQRIILIVKPRKVPTLDLSQKRGCFGHVVGVGVLGLAAVLPSEINGENLCDYDLRVARTLKDACMPGARDTSFHLLLPSDSDRMCNVCFHTPDSSTAVNCNADRYNYYYGPNGTQRCLEDERSDFAVVDLDDVTNLPNGTVIMCRNGTTVDSLQSVGDDCLLTSVPSIQFVANSQLTANRQKEIRDILLQALDPTEFYGVFVSTELTHEEELIFNNIDKCEHLLEAEPSWGGIIKIGVMTAVLVIMALVIITGIAIRLFNQTRLQGGTSTDRLLSPTKLDLESQVFITQPA